MIKNKLAVVVLLITLFSITIHKEAVCQNFDDTYPLTLQESIDLAIDLSPLSQSARYALIANQWRYRSFRADLLPGLSASGNAPNYRRSFRDNLNPDGTTSLIYTQQSNASFGLSIEQPVMPTGGNLSISTGITRLGVFANENTYLWSSTPVVIGYSQPLFQFNELKWRNRIEPLQLQIAQKEYTEAMESLSLTVTQRYFDLLLSRINLDIAEFNVAANDSIYNISQGRYNVGNIAENDLLQTELQLRNAESSLTQAQLNYDQQIDNFRLLLGLSPDIPIEVDIPEDVPEFHVDQERALQMARLYNSMYLNFEMQTLEAERTLDMAMKQSSFSATIQANYGLNQTSENFLNTYQEPLSQQFVALNFQIPIFNWGKQRAEVNFARNTQRQVADDIAFEQAQFDLQVQNMVAEFHQLRDQVLLAELSERIADRRYEVARNRYQIGQIDITNLFIAQTERDAALRSYIQAIRNYWISFYNLRRMTLFDFEQDVVITHDL
ncbi:TolC family protein [Rhodohalobacter sp. SW132]|uniref:TolC family protein n=1 Tax=Rhodohalobacter sp. SW132 TaxID=2293433 RepID=UPI001315683A|nr:TolC family protein [Rhodohalobacter sp. SW132]